MAKNILFSGHHCIGDRSSLTMNTCIYQQLTAAADRTCIKYIPVSLIFDRGTESLDTDNIWEQYQASTNVDTSIAAYTYKISNPADVDYDVHVDINVLIRQSNGEVRATLGTNVANSPNFINTTWTTVTGTWTPSEYVIVDPSDYLEISLFADVTRNDGTRAPVWFLIDDNTVANADQTGIDNLGIYRE